MALSPKLLDDKRRAAEALLAALPLPEGEAGWAREARARARTRLLDAGAPIRRDEYWKYTEPARLTEAQPAVSAALAAGTGPLLEETDPFPGVAAERAVFADGRIAGPLPAIDGVALTPLAEALAQDITPARDLFGALEAAGQEKVARPLASLNTATATEGLVAHVAREAEARLHIHQAQAAEGVAVLHHVVRVEPGAGLTILESGAAANTLLEVDIAPGGRFHHVRLQREPDRPTATHLFARIAEGAEFKTFTLTLDGSLTRNEVVIALDGDDATGHIAGAVLGRDEAHADNTVFVTHTGQRCESRQVFKNVLSDRARGIFQGKIFVRPGAQKTDGYQISQSILLSEGAEFSAKPELEIYADDVKCSHGSTTGALDRTALFYLMARGITRAEAEALLVASFVEEAIAEIEDAALAEVMRGEVACWMAARA